MTTGCRGKQYDGALKQCIEDTREPKQKHLDFLKWLYVRGDFEDDTSPVSGD